MIIFIITLLYRNYFAKYLKKIFDDGLNNIPYPTIFLSLLLYTRFHQSAQAASGRYEREWVNFFWQEVFFVKDGRQHRYDQKMVAVSKYCHIAEQWCAIEASKVV